MRNENKKSILEAEVQTGTGLGRVKEKIQGLFRWEGGGSGLA
jgi:hypothetical protein